MSVHARPVAPSPGLVDLGAARARVNRRLRWLSAASFLPFAPLVFLVLLRPVLPVGGVPSRPWLLAPLVVVATAVVAAVAVDRRCDRRAGGPASPGRSSVGEVVSSAPGPVLWRAVQHAFGSAGFSPAGRLDGHTVRATRWYRGNRYWLTVRVEGLGEGRARVTVWAHPDLGWFSGGLDYGRNRRHANAVLTAVPNVHEAVREPDTSSRA